MGVIRRQHAGRVITLRFDDGTLTLDQLGEHAALVEGLCVWDSRISRHRAKASAYAELLRRLHGKAPYDDQAKAYEILELAEARPRALRAYQEQAIAAWLAAQRRGVVVLPTGAGKSYVALRCMLACNRSTLVLAPTIDLVQQWVHDLQTRLGRAVGQYGGGEKNLLPVTVATYDSGVLLMPWHGNRFGLLVCDECHHLPAGVTASVAEGCLAPFRLGLTATPERADGMHARLDELLGPEVHRSHISELEGSFLANYQAEVVEVALDPDEQESYTANRKEYLAFARRAGVDFGAPDGWQRFIAAAARDPQGRAAMRCYREQKRLSRASRAKLRAVWDLLREHPGERALVFTEDNHTAYEIGRTFVLPVMTHHTKGPERKAMLAAFRTGTYPVLVTSKVLNEGVDVPEASVGIIVSGSGSVREHVQRLGRLLRPGAGKVAMLYEILSANTAEAYTSERRRSHVAFDGEQQREDFA
ncbi:MAG: DEAD/DEAH box helicase [Planctomycetes bacterium]|nr:DEAD/DEAH box helicase [Planctomycetota bacterium]